MPAVKFQAQFAERVLRGLSAKRVSEVSRQIRDGDW